MSLFERDGHGSRTWTRVGECYGITKRSKDIDVRSYGEIPFITMESIPQDGSYQASFNCKPPASISSGTYFELGDLLVSKITPSFENGKQALIQNLPLHFGYATTEVIPLRRFRDDQDPRLLFFYLLHPEVRHYIAERMEGSTGRQRVPEKVLLDLPFPDFDFYDQVRISETLEIIQSAISTEKKIEICARRLKTATMTHLFSRGLRGDRQKETEIGPIPESWEVVKFSQVREWLQYGTSIHCGLEQQRYPVLRIPNIEPGRVNVSQIKYCDLPESEARKHLLELGDLLFIRTNGVRERLGSCAVYSGEPKRSLFASYLIRARLKKGIDSRFVAYFYSSAFGNSLVSGRATPAADGKFNINTGAIDALPLPLPGTQDEQYEIVAILDAIDRKIDLHRQKRTVLEDLFQSLLHKLMTGEIRVDQLDLSALNTQHPAERIPA